MPRHSSTVRSHSTESSEEDHRNGGYHSHRHSSTARHSSSTTSRQTLPPISSIIVPPSQSRREHRSAVHEILNPIEPQATRKNELREPQTSLRRGDERVSSSRARDDMYGSSRHTTSHRTYDVPSDSLVQAPVAGSRARTSLSFDSSQGPIPGVPQTQMGIPEYQVHQTTAEGSASLQNAYRLLKLETDQGSIDIPVDLMGASRQADEKRRRNAGASARFRQRKKDKESASTREIDDMRQQIHELGEDAEFYRQERDYLVGALYNTVEGERHFPRRPSPRQYRSVQESSEMDLEYTRGPSQASDPHSDFEEDGDELRYARRRVTSSNPSDIVSSADSPQIYAQPVYTQMTQPIYQHRTVSTIPPVQQHAHVAPSPIEPPITSSRSSSSRHHSSHHSSRTTERSTKDSHRSRR